MRYLRAGLVRARSSTRLCVPEGRSWQRPSEGRYQPHRRTQSASPSNPCASSFGSVRSRRSTVQACNFPEMSVAISTAPSGTALFLSRWPPLAGELHQVPTGRTHKDIAGASKEVQAHSTRALARKIQYSCGPGWPVAGYSNVDVARWHALAGHRRHGRQGHVQEGRACDRHPGARRRGGKRWRCPRRRSRDCRRLRGPSGHLAIRVE